ncbi:dienelactone hydrolase family protein [Sphingomonas sp.]|jgi:carboxymethylenebutenolidase|uniref:dienelactone hydrolase family protein n=1 Tax=Sphingomonas sp. TaxID=28214 RepID=UPI002ED918E4
MTRAPDTLESLHDGFAFGILHRRPAGECRGGVVLLHEIFGLDGYMRADAERYATAGFEVIAPSLFDRASPGFAAAHDPAGIKEGFRLVQQTALDAAMGDISACVQELRRRGPAYMVGYCYGGRLVWQASAQIAGVRAAACYYGQIAPLAELAPHCPVICHFARKDGHIDADATHAAISAAHPEIPFHIYENSGHGFNNDGAVDADPADATLARARTLALFAAHAD